MDRRHLHRVALRPQIPGREIPPQQPPAVHHPRHRHGRRRRPPRPLPVPPRNHPLGAFRVDRNNLNAPNKSFYSSSRGARDFPQTSTPTKIVETPRRGVSCLRSYSHASAGLKALNRPKQIRQRRPHPHHTAFVIASEAQRARQSLSAKTKRFRSLASSATDLTQLSSPSYTYSPTVVWFFSTSTSRLSANHRSYKNVPAHYPLLINLGFTSRIAASISSAIRWKKARPASDIFRQQTILIIEDIV